MRRITMAVLQCLMCLAFALSVCNANSANISQVNEEDLLKFPNDFFLGASTAAFQIEGAWNVSGKGVSVWDNFVHVNSSRISNHDNGDVACDSYHKYKNDIALLKELGLRTYRFSVSWTRILPTGFINEVNQAGLDHYKNLLNELLANDIEPIVAMIHWDQPQTIEDLGGWTNELIVDWFADYARLLFRELGPKVKTWITMNEPEAHCLSGYSTGKHAPGKTVHGIGEYLCAHNALKAHARVYRIYQEEFKSAQNGSVGLTLNMKYFYPKNPETDQEAADIAFKFSNGWMFHPIFSREGDYPDVLKTLVARNSRTQGYPKSRLPTFSPEWVDYIRGSADFLGLNHYTSFLVERGDDGAEPSFFRDRGLIRSPDPAWKRAASSWLYIVPQGFGDILRRLATDYGNPTIYVTENGMSDYGDTDDLARVEYYHDYVREMLIAINRDGANVKGYLVWSLLDNFEWDEGYTEKFGIVKVDFDDPARKRTLKASARWWKRVAHSRTLQPIRIANEV